MIKIVMLTRQDGDEILWWAIWMQTFNWIYPSWETDKKLDMQQRATEAMCSTVELKIRMEYCSQYKYTFRRSNESRVSNFLYDVCTSEEVQEEGSRCLYFLIKTSGWHWKEQALKYLLSSFLLMVSGFADREQFCAGLKGTLIRCGSIHTGVRW